VTNETGGYETALAEFAHGKRLARLAKFVRAQSGDRCDACGSTLPRLLFGLKDVRTERFYFVGQNCLAWLLKAGLVARARFRESAAKAYENEFRLRHNGQAAETIAPDEIDSSQELPSAFGLETKGRWVRRDGALVFEQPRTDLQRVLILIALARVPDRSDGVDRK
jgi:hypothetical protein